MNKSLVGIALLSGVLQASAEPLLPADSPSATRQLLQDAIDAAAVMSPAGTIELGEGSFEIDSQLVVTGGVKIVGLGWNKSILRQTVPTAKSDGRVMRLKDGSVVEHVMITGGKLSGNWSHGGGVEISDGRLSWCYVTGNRAEAGNNRRGGGIGFYEGKGSIDHCIIADNYLCSTTANSDSFGGGIGITPKAGDITIDCCLIRDNTIVDSAGGGQGGGISVDYSYKTVVVTIRNTTFVGNSSGTTGTGKGGALYTRNDSNKKLKVINCIFAGNESVNSDKTVDLAYTGGVDYCLFDQASDLTGSHSKSGDPRFTVSAGGAYHLDIESPAVGSGVAYVGLGTDLDNTAFSNPPSMGCYEFVGQLKVFAPEFVPGDGVTFYPSVDVVLTCDTEGADIHYTTDGSDPTETSPLYTGAISLTETTTFRAVAFKEGMLASRIVEATYTYGEPTRPVFDGEVLVEPRATAAAFSGVIESIGNNLATSCDIFVSVGLTEDTLGEPVKIASAVTGSFSGVLMNLLPETTYVYVLTAENNGLVPQSASVSGTFTTPAKAALMPVEGDPAATRMRIQDEIDAAVREIPAGTVVLGEALFEINAQLMVTGGVTLVGQGWDKTVLKQVSATPSRSNRVMTIDNGSVVERMTVTGGHVEASPDETEKNYKNAGGVLLNDGTISWCCITNNVLMNANSNYGGGIGISSGKGMIDHSIIADNTVTTSTGSESLGGGIGIYGLSGTLVIDSCLIRGNRAFFRDYNGNYIQGKGAGVGICFKDSNQKVKIYNTTFVGNVAGDESQSGVSSGGALATERANTRAVTLEVRNCVFSGNVTWQADKSVRLVEGGLTDIDYCLFDLATDVTGEHSLQGTPKFRNAARGDYRMAPSSLGVDAGAMHEFVTDDALDLEGMPRKKGKAPDMGCYETSRSGLVVKFR